jgi:hypothetical protein
MLTRILVLLAMMLIIIPASANCLDAAAVNSTDENDETVPEDRDRKSGLPSENPESMLVQSRDTCECLPGDCNDDGEINVADVVCLIGITFHELQSSCPFVPCCEDANGDCQGNVGDAVYIISYVFKGGDPPIDCETWVGNCGPYEW